MKKQNQLSKRDLARQILLENPQITENRTLAKLLFAKYSAVFRDIEDARHSIRVVVGACGKKEAEKSKHVLGNFKERLDEARKQFPVEHRDNFKVEPYVFAKANKKALVISDIHIGHQDDAAIDIAFEEGDKFGIDTIIINGDLMDFPRLGKWLVKPSAMTVHDELQETENFLNMLRKVFPTQTIVYHAGNHCARWNNYIMRNAADLFGLGFMQLPEVLKLREKSIEYVPDTHWMEFGHLMVAHGHHIVKGVFAPVSPARGVQMKTFQSTIIGHLHKSSEHLWTNMQGKQYGTWSTGCLSDLKPEYNPQVGQCNLGFALVEKEQLGDFEVHNKKIIQGKVR
jgi:hypothetical protein